MLQPPSTADASPFVPPVDPIAPLRAALRGHYDIEREIGQGAFATVYLARDLKHERKVAIKVLNADPTSETGELRFIQEIRLLARLQHPNILPLHDSGHVEALIYYVMPFVSGETLRERIDRQGHLSIDDSACIAKEAADALTCAHSQGIIHRDIKPENILLSGGHAIVADFGIARAIDLAGIKQLTRTGFGSPGTPAYMSPEQMLGEREIDARSDLYSVGCVLYEMLTGKPPFAGKEGFAKRFIDAPPAPSAARPDVPAWLDEVIARTLIRNPHDRYPSALDLVHALMHGLSIDQGRPQPRTGLRQRSDVVTADSERSEFRDRAPVGQANPGARSARGLSSEVPEYGFRRGPSVIRSRIQPRLRLTVGSVIIILALATLVAVGAFKRRSWSLFGLRTAVDSSKLVILPFAGADKGSHNLAAQASDALYEGFRSWDGLNLVSDLQVNEAITTNGRGPVTLSEALALARRLGAGHLVWGHIVSLGNSVRPRAELYDVAQPTSSTKEVMIDPQLGSGAYSGAAIQLLAAPNRPAVALGGDALTRNYTAWQAYNRGHVALRSWDLLGAQADFEKAVEADPRFPVARLWLGQILEWQTPFTPERWREHAERAASDAPRMVERDRLLSIALAAMAYKRYPVACDAYRSLTGIDSLDFIGWYGLGECQGLDRTVLSDRLSPSGWRWRSSYDAAVRSYAHALRLEPGAHALLSFERLRRLLPTAGTSLRIDNPGHPTFAAYPSLAGDDTVAFVPYPVRVFAKGLPPGATSTLNRALDHNSDALFDLASRWVQLAPRNPDAYESLADVLETRGDIAGEESPMRSATAAVQQALLLSSDSQQRVRLAVREGILRFRRGDYQGTSRLADSLFARGDLVDNNDPPVLISLAALTGRVGVMAELAKVAALPAKLDGIAIPLAVTDVAASLFAAAALGVCGDTLAALRERLEQHIQSSVAEEQRATARAALVTRSLSMMVPCTAGASALDIPASANKLHRLQQAFARKDGAGVTLMLREMAETRRPLRPTDWSLDYIYQEAWVRAAMGDTTAAMAELDRSLNSISALSAPALKEAAASAAVGRAMALRAELAAQTGDSRSARRWARAVTELWGHADAPLQRTFSRMKTLAAAGP